MNQEGVLASCAVCKQQTHRRCARCLNVYYCNTEHQRQDWRRHKSKCAPKLQKQGSRNDNIAEFSPITSADLKKNTSETPKTSFLETQHKEKSGASENKHTKKSLRKTLKIKGSEPSLDNKSLSECINTKNKVFSNKGVLKNSVISSVVYTNKDLSKISAITHEGSSEQEILSEKAQQLNTVEFSGTKDVLSAVKNNVKMPALPQEPHTKIKEYPEASLKNSSAPFTNMVNSYYMDQTDSSYEICQRVIRDMTQYGVCVLNNFLGKERGLLVLQEVLDMYRSGIFTVGIFIFY